MNINPLVVVFAINVLSSALKRWIYPRFGVLGVQVSVFLLALVGALLETYKGVFPELKELMATALAIFSLAVAFYEVIWSKLDIFKVPKLKRV